MRPAVSVPGSRPGNVSAGASARQGSLCTNLWMTCAKAHRICAQRGNNGGDSRLAASFGRAITCENTIRTLCIGRKPKMSTGHAEMAHI